MIYVLLFIVSIILSTLFVSSVRLICLRTGRVVEPREDRWHHQPTPSFGGVGIYIAVIVSLVFYSIVNHNFSLVRWGLLVGGSIVFVLGFFDDFKRVSPQAKLVGQILAASVIVALGYTTFFFTPRIGDSIIAQIPNIILTIVWLVGITNAINLLDNMDGLAGGISLIAAMILCYFFWRVDDKYLLVIAITFAGCILGFLFFNFPPASIFMGDSGSMFIGFSLAALAIARQPQASNVFAVLGVPTILFLLPIVDTTLVTITRLLRGASPAQGGRDHTSHRLIAFGLSERQTLGVLYGVAIISGVVAIILESLDYDLSLVIVPVLIISLALFTAYLGRLKVVVTPGSIPGGAISKIMVGLTYRGRLLEIILDLFLISVAYYLAFWTLNGLNIGLFELEQFVKTLPYALVGAYISFFLFGVYRGVWKYVGVGDLLSYVEAAVGAVVLLAGINLFIDITKNFVPGLFLLFAVFLFLGLAATRSSFKILDLIVNRQNRQRGEERVVIYGAGDAGEMALRWIIMNPQLAIKPVGFIDDDPLHLGRQIHGIKILGDQSKLVSILTSYQISGVVIAISPYPEENKIKRIIKTCQENGCWTRILRLEFELVV